MPRALLLLLACAAAPAQAAPLDGTWEGPMGAVAFRRKGSSVEGVLQVPRLGVPFKAGSKVLRGTMLGDTLAVQVRMPLQGCSRRESWAAGMLLLAMNGNLLTGAVHVAEAGCRGSLLGKNGGLAVRRIPDDLVIEALADLRAERGSGVVAAPREGTRPPRPALPREARAEDVGEQGVAQAAEERLPLGQLERRAAPDDAFRQMRRAQAQTVMAEGASFLQEGRFEQAREKFIEAICIDPTTPEAYNGVGVSHYGRQQHAEAEGWYRRALAVDPDFGDAYYNLACLHAVAGRKDAAFRLLELAVKNGYTTDASLDRDPDLAGLRDDPRFAKIRKRGARR
jgi:Flp pilus assembly protein TadD